MTTLTTRLADQSSIATRLRRRRASGAPARMQYAYEARVKMAAGERPSVSVAVRGVNGLSVRLVVKGLPGTIAHARTRRRAREIARASVAAAFGLDPYAFDLQVDGA